MFTPRSRTLSHLASEKQMGTLSYMAPEMVQPSAVMGDGITKRMGRPVDIWALGVILSQMLNGGMNIFNEHLDRGLMSVLGVEQGDKNNICFVFSELIPLSLLMYFFSSLCSIPSPQKRYVHGDQCCRACRIPITNTTALQSRSPSYRA